MSHRRAATIRRFYDRAERFPQGRHLEVCHRISRWLGKEGGRTMLGHPHAQQYESRRRRDHSLPASVARPSRGRDQSRQCPTGWLPELRRSGRQSQCRARPRNLGRTYRQQEWPLQNLNGGGLGASWAEGHAVLLTLSSRQSKRFLPLRSRQIVCRHQPALRPVCRQFRWTSLAVRPSCCSLQSQCRNSQPSHRDRQRPDFQRE